MVDLAVDITGLEELVTSLARVREGLEGTRRVVDGSAEAMGSSRVAGALDHFEDHWDDGRGRVVRNIDSMSGSVGKAAHAYRDADDDLRDLLRRREDVEVHQVATS